MQCKRRISHDWAQRQEEQNKWLGESGGLQQAMQPTYHSSVFGGPPSHMSLGNTLIRRRGCAMEGGGMSAGGGEAWGGRGRDHDS